MHEESFELNKLSWEERVDAHVSSAFYDVAGFRAGRDALGPIESAEIGDVSGERIAHLQCHFGLDTLSLARRGAKVTGLDFSGKAIEAARRLAQETGIAATFVEGNVYDAASLLGRGQWDRVFTSWGTIIWLPDITRWADTIAQLLAPGGRLYYLDAHPIVLTLEQSEAGAPIQPAYDYFHGRQPIEIEEEGTYTDPDRAFMHNRTHEWIHPLSETIMALVNAGLRITNLREHDAVPWQPFPSMTRDSDKQWRLNPDVPRIPLAITIEAQKDLT
jgi:SAM-dependent methyltransferase